MTFGSTSGTYTFLPPLASITVEAFDRIGWRPPQLSRHHWISARESLNYIFVDWANRGINLWEVDLINIPLVANQATYLIDQSTVTLLDVYYTTVNGGGAGVNLDRLMLPIGRDEYAAIPNKLLVGTPTTYWYQKLVQPQITFWQPPEAGAPNYEVNAYRLRRTQDANVAMGEAPDVQYRFLDTLAYFMAERMAEKFQKDQVQAMQQRRAESWALAAGTDREDVNIKVQMDFGSYYR